MDVRPTTVDARTRTDSVQLRDLFNAIPTDCFHINERRSWLALFRVIACVALALAAVHSITVAPDASLLWKLPALCGLWLLQGWSMVGLFVLGHDCGHRSFSNHRWVNWSVGHACMSPLSNALHTWTVTHNHHHAHTQRRGEEVDWASHLCTKAEFEATTWRTHPIVRMGYALPFGIFFWIIANTLRRGFLVQQQIGARRFQREKRALLTSNLIMAAVVGFIYWLLLDNGGLWPFLKYYGVPGFIATATGALIITVQHANRHTLSYTKEGWTPLRGQLVSTFDVRFPRWIEWLWCDITIHIPHHVAPSMPWYGLRRASDALRAAHPGYYQTQPFSLWHLSWFAKTPFLREVTDRGFFVMDIPDNDGIGAAAK